MPNRYIMPRAVKQNKDDDDDRHHVTAIIFGVIAFFFAIAFLIMLLMFLFYKTEDIEIPTLFIYDTEGDWQEQENLDIFYNEEFGSTVVAPDSSGTYSFKFENRSSCTLEYNIVLQEENEYDLAFCYKLKRDGAYLQSEYVRTDGFTCVGLTIEGNSTHQFDLEWWWNGSVSDEKDTLAAINVSIYILEITFSAQVA